VDLISEELEARELVGHDLLIQPLPSETYLFICYYHSPFIHLFVIIITIHLYIDYDYYH